MKRLTIVISVLLLAVACSPIPYYIAVDVKNNPKYDIDITGRNIAIVTVNDLGDRDSALVSEVGMGIAEKIESDKNLEKGTVPVFSVVSPYTKIEEPGTLDMIAVQTSTDLIIAIDSLKVGEYDISDADKDNKVYSNGTFYNSTSVILPVKFKLSVYDFNSLSFVMKECVDDSLLWTMLSSEGPTTVVKATAKANSTLPRVFKEMGNDFASRFSGQWDSEERMVVSYDNEKWNRAYSLAANFKWYEAMNIWLELVQSSDPVKSACAAYNVAVASEMLEQYDIALEWLDIAKEKYYFREIGELKEKILKELR